jgi:glutathione S-transferase
VAQLVVHQIPSGWGLPSIGPFCLKLETYLRMVDLPYRTVVDATPFGAPKGKLPWIEHDGRKIGDSGLIIEYLEARLGCDPDVCLSAAERATARAVRRLVEENLYWTMVYDRWMVEQNWPVARAAILGRIPSPLRQVIAPIARRGVRRQLEGHGIGRHARDDIHAIGRADIGALAEILGDKPFLMGDTPTQVDAVTYGLLANIAWVPIESPVRDELTGRANLMSYLERIRARYFPAEAA